MRSRLEAWRIVCPNAISTSQTAKSRLMPKAPNSLTWRLHARWREIAGEMLRDGPGKSLWHGSPCFSAEVLRTNAVWRGRGVFSRFKLPSLASPAL
jgi:hypothetical protein